MRPEALGRMRARSPMEGGSAGSSRRRWFSLEVLRYAALSWGAIVVLLPLLWMVVTSLKPISAVFSTTWDPKEAEWANYLRALRAAPFGRYFANSIFVAGSVTVTQVLLGAMAGYGFAKFRFRARSQLFLAVLTTMMIPFQVIMLPLYTMMRWLWWLDSFQGLIVPGALTGFGVFVMRQFISTIPDEYVDAARMDGAGEWRVFWNVILPLSKNGLVALAILTFLASWDNLLWPLIVVSRDELRTIPLGLALFESSYFTQYNYQMAVAVMATIPVLVVYLILRPHIIRGVILSGVKG